MSSDGEITVEVNAENVDEAADDAAGAVGGDGGGGGGEGGLSQSIRGGIIGGLLASGLGSIIDILSPMLELLNAFLAPIAAIVLRALQPFLRFMLTKILPVWLSFFSQYGDIISDGLRYLLNPLGFLLSKQDQIRRIIGSSAKDLKAGIRSRIGDAITFIRSIPGRLGTLKAAVQSRLSSVITTIRSRLAVLKTALMQRLQGLIDKLTSIPGKLAEALDGVLPDLPSGPSFPSPPFGDDDGGDGGDGVVESVGQTVVNIGGGVPAFVDTVERSRRVE